MRTYRVLLHTFAVLLLCDYGMFSTSSPSPSASSITEISNISDSNTTLTPAEPTAVGNVSGSEDYESSGSNDFTTNATADDTDPPKLTEDATTQTSLATRPESRTRDKTALIPTADDQTSSGHHAVGVIILIFILILIVLLLGLLYFLRKKGRSYSFDLNRVGVVANDYVTPLRSDQQGISYEQTNKDLPVILDFIQEDKSEEKDSPIANGCAGEKAEQTPASENEDQNVPEENSFSSASSASFQPLTKVEFSLDLDLIVGDSDLNDPTTSEATDTAQNENNNNVISSGRGTPEEIFTEISLDEHK